MAQITQKVTRVSYAFNCSSRGQAHRLQTKEERKMSPVVPGRSWQGGRCAPPLHPPSHGSFWASNPSRASRPFRLSITSRAWRRPSPPAPNHGSSELSRSPEPHSQGDFALPAPIDLAGVPAPKTPDHAMEAISWRRAHPRPGREPSRYPSLEPSHRAGACHPLTSPTNPARIGCRQRIGT